MGDPEQARDVTWQEGVAVTVILLGLGAGAFLVAQRPAFWIEFGSRLLVAVFPSIAAYVSKRNTPEVEKAMADCVRRGGTWDNWRKRCR